MAEFNGRPLGDELRRLAGKCPGDCATAMCSAAQALASGEVPMFLGRPLPVALEYLAGQAQGDARAVIKVAGQALRAKA